MEAGVVIEAEQISSENSTDVNVRLRSVLSTILPNLALSRDDFIATSNVLIDEITIKNVDELNQTSIEKLKLFHQKVLVLIQSKYRPSYKSSVGYAKILNLLSLNIIPRYIARPFKIYFERVTFEDFLNQVLDLNFQNTSNMIDKATFILDELEELLIEEVLLQLSPTKLFIFKKVLAKLAQFFSLSELSKVQARKLDWLVKEKIQPIIGFDPILLEQDIVIEINPLEKDLTIKPLTLVSNPYQNKTPASQFKGVMLSNFHIRNLSLDLEVFGFSGIIQFELSYDDSEFHSDYLFLYQNQPLSMAITIENTYVFDDPEKKNTKYVKEISLQAIGSLGVNQQHLTLEDPLVQHNVDKQMSQFSSSIPVFSFQFCDPLQAFWREHKPIYIDFNKSYLDIFDDNIFFLNWVEIDYSKCKNLAVKQIQTIVATNDRSFYDYFIEVIANYSVYLVCDYQGLAKGKLKYFLYDNLSDIQVGTPKNSNLFTSYDLGRVEDIYTHITSTWQSKQSRLNINTAVAKTDEILDVYPKEYITINGMLNIDLINIGDSKIYNNTSAYILNTQKQKFEEYTFTLALKEIMPLVDFFPSYELIKLDKTQWLCSLTNYCSTIFISRQKINFKINKATTVLLQNKLLEQNYDGDEEKDRFEKITMIGQSRGITHNAVLECLWSDMKNKLNLLPKYIHFKSFKIDGEIFIGKNVDDSVLYGYKFYKGQTEAESSYADDSTSKLDTYRVSDVSENAISYAVTVPKILFKDQSKDQVLYVPVPNVMSNSHMFYPLRNKDVVELNIINAEKIIINSTKLNTAVCDKKSSEEFTQQELYGSEQICQMSYKQNSEDQQWAVKQTKNEDKGFNALALSQKKGILFSFSDEKDQN